MNDILIKSISMPKKSEVLIVAIKSDGSVYPVRIDGEGQPMIFENEEMQNKSVPVPPHGRLIDADALCETLRKMADNEYTPTVFANWIENHIDSIIPADLPKEE